MTLEAWDCHAHVFGPYVKFRLASDRSYTPPEAPLEAFVDLQKRLGTQRAVLVHPRAYGADHRLLFEVLQRHPVGAVSWSAPRATFRNTCGCAKRV